MDKMLEKMARQLNAYDEASLMRLWEQYAMRAQTFEPSKRWEEAVLVLSFIQAVRWKNQLFNYQFAATVTPPAKADPVPPLFSGKSAGTPAAPGKKATHLSFPSRRKEENP